MDLLDSISCAGSRITLCKQKSAYSAAKHGKAADAVNGLHGAVQVIGNSSSITDFFVSDRLLHLIFQNQIEDT